MKELEIILNSYSLSNASERLFGKGRTNTKYHNKIRKILNSNGYAEDIFNKKKRPIKYPKITKECPICKKVFDTNLGHKKEKKFCSANCSHKLRPSMSKETKEKIRNSTYKLPMKPCEFCKESFKPKRGKQRFCSVSCARNSAKKNPDPYLRYRALTTFTFGLSDYPEKFNFALIENFGWYSPSNSNKPNLNGVSRDHIYSVMDGFENNIDPNILAHPANCRLMRHNDNISKYRRSDITIDQLLEKIKKWDIKY